MKETIGEMKNMSKIDHDISSKTGTYQHQMQKGERTRFKEEYVGDGDRAITKNNEQFPRIFITNRFSDLGYDLYRVEDLEQYQKFLFNDEFAAVDSKEERIAFAKNLKEARKKAKEILNKK